MSLAWAGIAYLILIAWITEARGRGKGIFHLMLRGDVEEVTKNPLIVAAIEDPIKPTTVANLGWAGERDKAAYFSMLEAL